MGCNSSKTAAAAPAPQPPIIEVKPAQAVNKIDDQTAAVHPIDDQTAAAHPIDDHAAAVHPIDDHAAAVHSIDDHSAAVHSIDDHSAAVHQIADHTGAPTTEATTASSYAEAAAASSHVEAAAASSHVEAATASSHVEAATASSHVEAATASSHVEAAAASAPVEAAASADSHHDTVQGAAAPDPLPDAAPAEQAPETKWVSEFDPNEPFADPEEPKEVPVLDMKMAMEQVGDDQAFLSELIRDMLTERDKRVQELNDAIENNDAMKCRMAAHTIKGAAENIGLKALGRRAKIIERFCDNILNSTTQESLNVKGSPYIVMIKEEYAKIEHIQNERFP